MRVFTVATGRLRISAQSSTIFVEVHEIKNIAISGRELHQGCAYQLAAVRFLQGDLQIVGTFGRGGFDLFLDGIGQPALLRLVPSG